jgi:hypothetical protein
MIEDGENAPCIYLKTKQCGKKFELFYYEENLSLTNKAQWEKVVLRKMNEWNVEKKFQPIILDFISLILPAIVLTFCLLLSGSFKK